ncbi:MAG TPA: hypoxanthine phosphoribosyltransferase [Terriglobales bacterium]|nr:hypoxanthine phosphoribosyltransferase [Terriglobales bacterium]
MNKSINQQINNLPVLFSRSQIAARVAELGAEITRDFAGQPVVFLGVLKGATIFLSDLARSVSLDATFDFLAVSSYGSSSQHSGEVRLTKDVDQSMEGKNVILVEDILDTGLTLTYLKNLLLGHRPRALRVAVLLDKPARRLQSCSADYIGFRVEGDPFLVGYGLDHAERFRNLPDICILPTELMGSMASF